MPTPFGHALAGLTVHCATADPASADRREMVLVTAAALAPDLDLLLRFVDGQNHHQGASHSVGAAILAAALTWVVLRQRTARAGSIAVAVGLGWLSHVVLDYLSRDTSPPIGLLALWPICASYFKTPWPVFLDVGRSLDLATALHDLKAALWEAVLLGPALVLAARRVLRRQ